MPAWLVYAYFDMQAMSAILTLPNGHYTYKKEWKVIR